jgi:hypothetical protein
MASLEITSRLAYRRQFLLGPTSSTPFQGWPSVNVAGGLQLTTHPDLEVTQVASGGLELTLLGDIVDWTAPELDNLGVLTYLATEGDTPTTAHEILRRTARCGGRWLLIADDGQSTILWHDAGGLRQVFHSTDVPGGPWCATQPERIAEALGLELDPVAVSGFLESEYVASNRGYFWPVDSSPYKEIKRLLPNHYLDLRTHAPIRYWPSASIEPISTNDAVRHASMILQNLIRGASRRFPLALPITAGVDSRCLLAASRDIASQLYFYTFHLPDGSANDPDITVSRKVLEKLGLQHHVVHCPKEMTGPFGQQYRANCKSAREWNGAIAQGLLEQLPSEMVCVTGHASEIARCCYYRRPRRYPDTVTVDTLLLCSGTKGNAFAAEHIERWLQEARSVKDQTGFPVLDLFYWENRVGAWASAAGAEWDIVIERFPPYSCRELLETLLATDPEDRKGGSANCALYISLIRQMWAEVLCQPINPPAEPSFRDRVHAVLKATGTEPAARRILQALRRRPTDRA